MLSGDTVSIDVSDLYPANNPSGFITGISNLVYTTGNQAISGVKNFIECPTVAGSLVMISGDNFYSANGQYNFKMADDGGLVISDHASILATIESTGLANRVITLPNKDGVIATLEDITASAGDANSIVSQDGSKRITLNNVGELEYQHGTNNETFSLPSDGGTIGLRGGDTYFGAVPPEVPYRGLRWIDTELGKSFDWLVDSNNIGAWFESSVGTDGKSVSLRVSDGYIQWQYMGDFAWNNLIALDLLKGDTGLNGSSVELRVTASHIQWKLVTSMIHHLQDLLSLIIMMIDIIQNQK